MDPFDMAKIILLGLFLYALTAVYLIYWSVVNNDRPDGVFHRETSRDTNPSESHEDAR